MAEAGAVVTRQVERQDAGNRTDRDDQRAPSQRSVAAVAREPGAVMSTQSLLSALDQFRGHLTTHDLPEVVSVTVSRWRTAVQVLHRDTDAQAARNLLTWAWSLSGVDVTAWRPASSPDAMHLTVHGLASNGLAVEVYASVEYRPEGPGGGLAPGERTDLSLDELRAAAGGASCD